MSSVGALQLVPSVGGTKYFEAIGSSLCNGRAVRTIHFRSLSLGSWEGHAELLTEGKWSDAAPLWLLLSTATDRNGGARKLAVHGVTAAQLHLDGEAELILTLELAAPLSSAPAHLNGCRIIARGSMDQGCALKALVRQLRLGGASTAVPEWASLIPQRFYSSWQRQAIALGIGAYTAGSVGWACWQLYNNSRVWAPIRTVRATAMEWLTMQPCSCCSGWRAQLCATSEIDLRWGGPRCGCTHGAGGNNIGWVVLHMSGFLYIRRALAGSRDAVGWRCAVAHRRAAGSYNTATTGRGELRPRGNRGACDETAGGERMGDTTTDVAWAYAAFRSHT